jgi:hypothetical protein
VLPGLLPGSPSTTCTTSRGQAAGWRQLLLLGPRPEPARPHKCNTGGELLVLVLVLVVPPVSVLTCEAGPPA